MYDVQKSDEQKRKRFATYIVHKQTFKVSLRVSLLQYISDVPQISKILCVKKKILMLTRILKSRKLQTYIEFFSYKHFWLKF